ncbi:hypothetical protein [Variovorax sp. J22R115]|uniref:hypothetical protein n=1 Tax=Variovorax sp. J22R115 TaxID=3053509 RepID=UPI002577271C|nr:hypothetical protein [Variovorax sp. J22R115]MDM0050928.1 hypothetical protein [Variovorax sp. J22R115]
MKRLAILAALAALALPSMAETLLTTPNKAGGLIRLTDSKGDLCRTGELQAYSTDKKEGGSAFFGCWRLDEGDAMVFIRWSSGRDLALPLGAFEMTPAVIERVKALDKSKEGT